ncbi:hypothetical protein JTB14_028697 [Gonioctena quinquepunctata]|nr:hypothetical protein JTB14_028697 [Gonioctena quinquepunctata]
MTKQQPKNLPVVIVKLNKPQNAELTKSEIQTKINPRALQVSINSVNTGYNGNLIIKCNSQKETVKLIEEAQKQDLSNTYQIQMSQLKKPRIKIITTNNNMDKEEIEECLRSQNEFVTPEDYLKVTFIKKVTNGKVTVCAECSAPLFKKFMDNKKVFISWERCPVYEDLTISRCKICNDFDHKDKYCKNKITCVYCGDEHKIEDCPKQLKKCCNCLRANKKYKLNYDVNHENFQPLTKTISQRPEELNLTLLEERLVLHDEACYLGVTFTRTLNWQPDLDKTLDKVRKRASILRALGGQIGRCHSDTLIHTYKTYIRPILEY